MVATMKIVLIVLALQILRLCNAATSSSSEADESGDGSHSVIPTCLFGADNVGFVVFTRENPGGTEISIGQKDVSMVVGGQIIFLVHGFTSEANASAFYDLANTLLERDNVNVISVDWREGACSDGWTLIALLGYPRATENTREVGRYMANLTIWLEEEGISKINETILIGHSLGAHVCGFAGKAIEEMTGLLYEQIIALDPAAPGYELRSCEERVCESDAQFVQAFHTSATLGMIRPIGDVDFFFNGGFLQPGCIDPSCSHSRSITYMTETLLPRCYFVGTPWKHLLQRTIPTSECNADKCSVAGFLAPRFKARGSFMVNTKSTEPYCTNTTLTITP